MLRKRGRYWHFQVKVNGKPKSWSTGETTKRQAERKVPELMRLAQLQRERPGGSPRLFRAIAEEVARLETDVSMGQARRVADSLGTFARWIGEDIELSRIGETMLRDYMRHRVRCGRARSTVGKDLTYLRRVLNRNGFVVPKPRMIPAPYTRNRRFSDDELVAFFAEATDRFRPLWLILLATGCRLSDMVPSVNSNHRPVLKTELDLGARTVRVRPSKLKPNEEPLVRHVRFSEEMVPVFEEQLRRTPKQHPYLFEVLWKAGRSFNATLKRADIEKKTPQGKLTIHSFRATYISKMGEALNGNAWLLREIAGHKNVKTTQIYCQPEAPVVPISMLRLLPSASREMQDFGQTGGKEGWQSEEGCATEAS